MRICRVLAPLISLDASRGLLCDPDAGVRSSALIRSLPTLITDSKAGEIQWALLDTHNSVRLQVQYTLRQAGHDVRQIYLDIVDLRLSPRE
ncbi:hypothetical protein EHF33_15670 [Deinococcus psychrotolerans]|uniref:Uncharacterized protein n=1 Tax=Deinococcus psychrotolerans TaxID=2489213 RepID=A0A3G8YNX9_9DEIO|nr:hypothetical protein EHF33_15670 [Deinococcus psychrotolerans]